MTINRLKMAKVRIARFKANVTSCNMPKRLVLDLSNLGLLNGHLRGLLNFLDDNELEKISALNLSGNAKLSEIPDCVTKMHNLSDIMVTNTMIPGKTAWETIVKL
jgi:hypothetical protein